MNGAPAWHCTPVDWAPPTWRSRPSAWGAWAIGGGGWAYGWGPQDDAASIATSRAAVDRGVNWVDTAAIHGLGHSEEVVGRAVRGTPAGDRPYVFTKVGMIFDPARPYDEPARSLQPASSRFGRRTAAVLAMLAGVVLIPGLATLAATARPR